MSRENYQWLLIYNRKKSLYSRKLRLLGGIVNSPIYTKTFYLFFFMKRDRGETFVLSFTPHQHFIQMNTSIIEVIIDFHYRGNHWFTYPTAMKSYAMMGGCEASYECCVYKVQSQEWRQCCSKHKCCKMCHGVSKGEEDGVVWLNADFKKIAGVINWCNELGVALLMSTRIMNVDKRSSSERI